jgi:hypothetical protein
MHACSGVYMGHRCSAIVCAMLPQGNIERCILISLSIENGKYQAKLAISEISVCSFD